MAHDAEKLATIERAAKAGIGIVAMKTQAGGTVRPDSKLPKELPPESQTALLKWVLNHDFITTAIPGFSNYDHLEQDFSVVRNLAYTDSEKTSWQTKPSSLKPNSASNADNAAKIAPRASTSRR